MSNEKNREEVILKTLDECINDSPKWGIMPTSFRILKDEVEKIINERNTLSKKADEYQQEIECLRGENRDVMNALKETKDALKVATNQLVGLVTVANVLATELDGPDTIDVVLDDGAVEPKRAHEHDAGLDLFAREDFVVPAHGSAVHDTGVHLDIPVGYAGILESKSGLNVKHGIVGTGTIDTGYTGSIVVKLYNHSQYDYSFKRGEKIIQLVLKRIATPTLNIVESLETTERGNGGFGSTGK